MSVNNEICEAHGVCYTVDPDLFTLDEDGYSNIGRGREVPPGKEGRAQEGVDLCPVQALMIEPET